MAKQVLLLASRLPNAKWRVPQPTPRNFLDISSIAAFEGTIIKLGFVLRSEYLWVKICVSRALKAGRAKEAGFSTLLSTHLFRPSIPRRMENRKYGRASIGAGLGKILLKCI